MFQGEVSVIDFLSLNPLFVATSSPGAAEDGAQSEGETYEDVRLVFLSSLLFQFRQHDGIETPTTCARPARRAPLDASLATVGAEDEEAATQVNRRRHLCFKRGK